MFRFALIVSLLAITCIQAQQKEGSHDEDSHGHDEDHDEGHDEGHLSWIGLFQGTGNPYFLVIPNSVESEPFEGFTFGFMEAPGCDEAALEEIEELFEEAFEHAEHEELDVLEIQSDTSVAPNATVLFELIPDSSLPITVLRLDVPSDACYALALSIAPDELGMKHVLHDSSGNEVELKAEHEHGHEYEAKSKPWGKAIGASIITTIPSIGGILLIVPAVYSFNLKGLSSLPWSNIFHALAGGALLSVVFLHIYPEALAELQSGSHDEIDSFWRSGTMVMVGWAVSALLRMFLNMAFCGPHHHSHSTPKANASTDTSAVVVFPSDGTGKEMDTSDPEESDGQGFAKIIARGWWVPVSSLKPSAWGIFFGDACHNFVDGALIAAAFQTGECSDAAAWAIAVAILAHEIPQEVIDAFIFIEAGCSFPQMLLLNVLSGLSSLLGVVVILGGADLSSYTLSYFLLFGCGLFLYIAATDILPNVLDAHQPIPVLLISIAFVFGAVIVALPLLEHNGCGHSHGSHGH